MTAVRNDKQLSSEDRQLQLNSTAAKCGWAMRRQSAAETVLAEDACQQADGGSTEDHPRRFPNLSFPDPSLPTIPVPTNGS